MIQHTAAPPRVFVAIVITLFLCLGPALAAPPAGAAAESTATGGKVCGVYTSVVNFASPAALKAAADAGPYVVLKPKHIANFAKADNSGRVAFCRDAGFD